MTILQLLALLIGIGLIWFMITHFIKMSELVKFYGAILISFLIIFWLLSGLGLGSLRI